MWLVLEDRIVAGAPLGASGTAFGELVFNTGMTGYVESLTDPSYHGQVLMFTYPMIGNYGVDPSTFESSRVWPRAVVVREWCHVPDHRGSTMDLDSWLKAEGIPGISGIDTRRLTLQTRQHGCMPCFVTDDEAQLGALQAKLASMPPVENENLAAQASVEKAEVWGGDGPTVAVMDTGVKANILRNLARRFRVVRMPWDASADAIRGWDADALFIANGPGDPGHPELAPTIATIGELAKELPTFGICFGNQLVARAFGANTSKMPFGHRGANIPVRDDAGRIHITSQNHGFAVNPHLEGTGLRVWQTCPNDGTVEGLMHTSLPVFTTQYHPEACPGPWDSGQLFDAFHELVRDVSSFRAGQFPVVRPVVAP